jgi:hypothetical protein
MEVLSLQVFVSLMLVVGSVLLFAFSCRQRDFDHADRLALLPMDEDAGKTHSNQEEQDRSKGDDRS